MRSFLSFPRNLPLWGLGLLLTVGCASQQPADSTVATGARQLPPAEERAAAHARQLGERLDLTDDRQAEVEAVLLEYARRNEAVLRNASDRRGAFTQMRTNAQAQDREMKKLLTEPEYLIYEEMRDEQRARMRERMQQNRGGRRGF